MILNVHIAIEILLLRIINSRNSNCFNVLIVSPAF
uniref:Uncharacterized protein n=1 Tax=virus sp. ctmTa7 TaxID=2828255 RepID=A0A8S5RBN0_9VIRU|nr:MAG TPA: hypothetical protein [virus sp. ctmTa7]